ncbi:hypothetical protein ABG775_24420 [Peribacillus simplex]|uniref:hypothetical protein n=1 Tax=Peribacillus simplex TaxID=1478 RepID=UPI003395806D
MVGKDIDPGYLLLKLSIEGEIEFMPSKFEKAAKMGQKIILKDPGYYCGRYRNTSGELCIIKDIR